MTIHLLILLYFTRKVKILPSYLSFLRNYDFVVGNGVLLIFMLMLYFPAHADPLPCGGEWMCGWQWWACFHHHHGHAYPAQGGSRVASDGDRDVDIVAAVAAASAIVIVFLIRFHAGPLPSWGCWWLHRARYFTSHIQYSSFFFLSLLCHSLLLLFFSLPTLFTSLFPLLFLSFLTSINNLPRLQYFSPSLLTMVHLTLILRSYGADHRKFHRHCRRYVWMMKSYLRMILKNRSVGTYEDRIFHVQYLGSPPAEKRAETLFAPSVNLFFKKSFVLNLLRRKTFGNTNFFGGPSIVQDKVVLKYVVLVYSSIMMS